MGGGKAGAKEPSSVAICLYAPVLVYTGMEGNLGQDMVCLTRSWLGVFLKNYTDPRVL